MGFRTYMPLDIAEGKPEQVVRVLRDRPRVVMAGCICERFPEEGRRMRKAARRTAHQFTWESAVQNLIGKLKNQARAQGVLAGRAKPASLPLFEIEDRPDTESQQCQEAANRTQNSEQEAKRRCQCIGRSPRAGEASLSRRMSGAARSAYAAERQTTVAGEGDGDGGGGDVDNAQKVSAMQR